MEPDYNAQDIVETGGTACPEDAAAPCPGCQRQKHRSPAEERDLIHRLNRIEGQIRGIRAMVERSAYCPDILVQTAAASAALGSFGRVLLARHIRSCVAEDLRQGKDETVDELIATIQKLMR